MLSTNKKSVFKINSKQLRFLLFVLFTFKIWCIQMDQLIHQLIVVIIYIILSMLESLVVAVIAVEFTADFEAGHLTTSLEFPLHLFFLCLNSRKACTHFC